MISLVVIFFSMNLIYYNYFKLSHDRVIFGVLNAGPVVLDKCIFGRGNM